MIWNRFHHAYSSRGSFLALLSALTILLFATAADAQGPIVVSQETNYSALPAGGVNAGMNPVGTSWGVNSKGVAVVSSTYGNNIYEFSPPTYAATLAGPFANASGVAIDNNGFLYVADQYNQDIVKFPMNSNGTYGPWTADPTATGNTTPTCAGDTKTPDTAGPCLLATLTTNGTLGYFGVSAVAFDSTNTLYFVTDDAGSEPYSIYQCNTKCLYPASGATAPDPVLIYAEPTTPAGQIATVGQLIIGGLAFDPWGDLFFTDAAVWGNAPGNGGGPGSYSSNLNELPVVTKAINSTLFAATPSVIVTETNATPISSYNDAINAVSIAANGNVYIGLSNSGIYGLTSNGTLDENDNGVATVSASSLFGITNQGTKLLATDNNGNLYAELNTNTFAYITTGPTRFTGPVTVGTAESANVVVADSTENCSSADLSFSESSSVFTVTPTTGTSCGNASLGTGSFTPETITYTPAVTGFVPGTITATDGTSTASAKQPVASSGAVLTISQSTYGAKLLAGGAWGGTSPDGSSGAVNSKGVFVIGSSYGNDIEEFTSQSTVATSVGPLSGGGGVAIDSNGYLFASNEYGNNIYKIPMNADGTYGPWTTDPSATGNTTPTCVGDGKAPDNAGICVIATQLSGASLGEGTAALAFDKNGNLFISTSNNNGGPNAWLILECNAACLYSGGDAAQLFAEPKGAKGDAQLNTGAIAVDSNDNVFFTDSSLDPEATEMSDYSDVYEIPFTASAYATTPTLLETVTPLCTALAGCTYNNAITALAVDASNDVYFGTPYGGVWEIVNNSGTLETEFPIAVAGQAVKVLTPDVTTPGNFYFVNYNGGDTAGYLQLGSVNITAQASSASPQSVTNVTAIDNYAVCGTSQDDLTFEAADGFSAAETAGDGCGTVLPAGTIATFAASASYPVTVTFAPTPSDSGIVTTTLTGTDAATGDTGTAKVTGDASTAQPITGFKGVTSPVLYGSGPYTLSATGGASGNPVVFSLDTTSAAGAATISGTNGTTLTITGVGTVVIDANQAGGLVGGVNYAAGYLQVSIVVNPATQTITLPTLPTSITYGSAVTLPTATGGDSGNPVTYTIDNSSTAGVATLSGSTLTATGLGTIVLDLNQAGNTDYSAAAQVQASITVTQAAQTITISASPTNPVAPATSTITATGGASGNPVTLAITSGGTIATLSGTTLTPTNTAFGDVVVTASQAGNTDYAAATPATVTVTFTAAGTVATPTFTPASGTTLTVNATNTITIADATGGAAIWYTLNGGAATAYPGTGGITLPLGTDTVTAWATETGYNNSAVATATYSVVTVPPTYSLTASPSSLTVSPGTAATSVITVTPTITFLTPITFACSGAPAGVTCTFSPASVTPTAGTAVSTTLTITDGATSALQHGPNPFLPGGVTFAIALGFLGWKKRRGMFLALALVAGVICLTQLTGCGGGGSAPQKNVTTMSVTATSNGVTQTLPLTVTVDK